MRCVLAPCWPVPLRRAASRVSDTASAHSLPPTATRTKTTGKHVMRQGQIPGTAHSLDNLGIAGIDVLYAHEVPQFCGCRIDRSHLLTLDERPQMTRASIVSKI